MSEVKIQVRHHALMLGTFTVSDIVRITAFKPESVRTELQRMRRSGLLTSTPPHKDRAEGGTREWTYALVEDSRARLGLSREIQSFLRADSSSTSESRPQSNHFYLARQSLDRAQNVDEPESSRLACDAEISLRFAAIEDSLEDAPPLRAAYLRFELARLDYVRGRIADARSRFDDLLKTFEALGIDEMAKRVEEHLVCLNFARWDSSPLADNAKWRLQEIVDTVRSSAFATDSPLAAALLSAVKQLEETAGAPQIAAMVKRSAEPKLSFIYTKGLSTHVEIRRRSASERSYIGLAEVMARCDDSPPGARGSVQQLGSLTHDPAYPVP